AMMIVVLTTNCGVSKATPAYNVGEDAGWTSMGNVDYQDWAAKNNFHVVCNYNSGFHNVKQVTRQDYEPCNATSPITTFTNDYDSITLDSPDDYYLCGSSGYCLGERRLTSVT
ncbi:Cu_bind_like domain-containing protein, partial [Cephalotus follicularis]